jgi:hypothetical protein
MEMLLQHVTDCAVMSMLDVFSEYNQVLVADEYKHKTTFTTPWGTYAYSQIPFGMMNIGATFEICMDHAFKDMIGKIMKDYQDDLTIYSKLREHHLSHLHEVFEQCTLYGISLNPNKCLFLVS